MKRYRKIFIACPISKYLIDGGMDQEFAEFVRPIYHLCRDYARDVFFALEREKYGAAVMDGQTCTPLDYRAMIDADLILAIPEDSMGVAVELGWASALNKDILLVLEEKYRYSPLISAIHSIAKARYINLPSHSRKSEISGFLLPLLEEALGGSASFSVTGSVESAGQPAAGSF